MITRFTVDAVATRSLSPDELEQVQQELKAAFRSVILSRVETGSEDSVEFDRAEVNLTDHEHHATPGSPCMWCYQNLSDDSKN